MKLKIEAKDDKWSQLRSHLYKEGRCAQKEECKATVLVALAERWRDRGISGSSSDWWTRYPNELFDLEFYRGLVDAEREGKVSSFLLYLGFRTILDLVPPQGFAQRFWLLHGGGHKIHLLKALLGEEEYARQADPNHWVLLYRTNWDLSLYLGSSQGLDPNRKGKSTLPPELANIPGAQEIVDFLESDEFGPEEGDEEEDGPRGWHIADYWDGEIINCDEFEDFDKVWSQLESVKDELGCYEEGRLYGRLRKKEHIEFVSSVIEALCMSSSQALCALADFEESDTINTSGPLSGSGYHLYHENPRIILDLTYKCEEILERGRSALERMSRVVTA